MVTYFIWIRKEHKLLDTTLGLLFFAIGLRISKSIFYYVFWGISAIGVAFGFLGFASIGPLLLLYFKISKNHSYKIKWTDLLHFAFAISGFIFLNFTEGYGADFYALTKIQLSGYLIFIGYKHIYFPKEKIALSKWHNTLFYAMICFLAVVIFQYLVGNMKSYTIGTALASAIIYVLFFIAIKSPFAIKNTGKMSLPEGLLEKIVNAIENENIYKQPSITLAQFSKAIHTPTYLVSKATKSIYKKSFPEVINSFRIKEIKKKLSQPEYSNNKVEDLAYDVGFNTSSAFYNAFKKETSMSPRAYQKLIQEKTTSN